jgi:hypothetical protein
MLKADGWSCIIHLSSLCSFPTNNIHMHALPWAGYYYGLHQPYMPISQESGTTRIAEPFNFVGTNPPATNVEQPSATKTPEGRRQT